MFTKKIFLSIFMCVFSSIIFADCSISITGDDEIKYNTQQIIVPARCKEFTINITHTGFMPKTAVGHNIVIAKTSDIKEISRDGIRAGVANNYLQPNDSRIIASSNLIGGNEKTSVTFPVNKIKTGDYSFFCSFPGHSKKMQGKLIVR